MSGRTVPLRRANVRSAAAAITPSCARAQGAGVLLAYDQELRRTVALKVLAPDHADDKARARFVREDAKPGKICKLDGRALIWLPTLSKCCSPMWMLC